MEKNNNKISSLQVMSIAIFIINSLFVGIGIVNTFTVAKQDAWIVNIISIFLGLLPIGILLYIVNYRPDKNILEKNEILFGKIIGKIINSIIVLIVLFLMIIAIWSTTDYATTMYLTKTPSIFIAFIFVFTAVYAVTQGIETISRTSLVLMIINIILTSVIAISLYFQSSFDELKPILVHGIGPVIINSLKYTCYSCTPIIILSIIPKNDIVDNKKYNKYMLWGMIIATGLMFLVFYLIPAVITPKLAAFYRFPAYYVLRRISIGASINNVENFLGIHWFLFTFILIAMCIYFINKYVENTFNVKKTNILNIITIIISSIAILIAINIFKNSTIPLNFMKDQFPYISILTLIIALVICILAFIKKRKEKTT